MRGCIVGSCLSLARVLGPECEPILVTDAWFRVWWFELVE
jgi:hypothetical protein